MTEQHPNIQNEAEVLPEGVTPHVEDEIVLNADDYKESLNQYAAKLNAHISEEEALSKKMEDVLSKIGEAIDAQPKGNRLSEEELSAGIAEFQKTKLEWDRMSPEEQQAAIAAGKHEPVLGEFIKTA
ncbi:MAG TPA: hypothetical protein VJ579_02230 [Candidatus Paceibacterota bacterium]|nr:hypothetical protein [Candidatus Paceibacterota bacterium]